MEITNNIINFMQDMAMWNTTCLPKLILLNDNDTKNDILNQLDNNIEWTNGDVIRAHTIIINDVTYHNATCVLGKNIMIMYHS